MKCIGKATCVALLLAIAAAAICVPVAGLYLVTCGPDWMTSVEKHGNADGGIPVLFSCVVAEVLLLALSLTICARLSDDD